MSKFSYWFIFFFQAEDGIRDYKVTGVQTCALPISATGAVTTAISGPLLGRWADTHGQRRTLLPVLAVFVAAGCVFLPAVKEEWPRWILFASAGLAGACIPPVASMIRVRWTHLLRGTHR